MWSKRVVLLIALGSAAAGAQPAAPAPKNLPGKPPALSELGLGVLEVGATPSAIRADNLRAASVLYRAAALEELRFFAVADRIADHFASGKLPTGAAGRQSALKYVRERGQALSEDERRRMYGHVLGDSGAATPNTAFPALLARFIGAVEDYDRQATAAALLAKQGKKVAVNRDGVHRAARDLAQNLSNRSYGAPSFAASALAAHIRRATELLSHPDVLSAYGAKDMWQVVDKVARTDLGATVDASKQRTLAEAGSQLIDWLAEVSQPLETSGGASAVETSLVKRKVPERVRKLSRVLSPQAKLAKAAVTGAALQVAAICFDSKRRLVPCKVKIQP
ncbi:MAG: hypothetical protein R3B13_30390 [Polyangiaceae bacterium]